MKLIDSPITLAELNVEAKKLFGDMIKAVVDIEQEIMVIGGELHADEEALLMQRGSKQADLWGINLYPEVEDEDWLEFDSMINLRPSQGNSSRGVKDPTVQEKIKNIVKKLIAR